MKWNILETVFVPDWVTSKSSKAASFAKRNFASVPFGQKSFRQQTFG
jgi:hypothetical protein